MREGKRARHTKKWETDEKWERHTGTPRSKKFIPIWQLLQQRALLLAVEVGPVGNFALALGLRKDCERCDVGNLSDDLQELLLCSLAFIVVGDGL